MDKKIFYNSSLPRSGSTLLQNILAQNPDIYATPTSGVLELIFGARANYSESPEFKAQDAEQMKAAFLKFCHDGMQGFYEAITDKPYVIDKSRGWGIHFNLLQDIHGEPKIICTVRDIRDIITSMEKKFRQNQQHHDKIVNHAEMRGTSTPKRVDIWMSGAPVGLAMERLQEIIRQGLDKKIHFVRFEDLCKYPKVEMDKIYKYLGIPAFEHDFDNIQQLTFEDDEVYGIYGDHKIRTKLEEVKSQHREILGKDIDDWFFNTYRWFFDKFGYRQ